MNNEKELLSQLKSIQTQEKAFRELITLYKERLYWHIRKIVISHDDSDDVLQNTFIKIYKNIKGSIVEDYKFFKPKKNEILFFYGVNNETKKTEMFFKIHTNLKGAYKEKEFEKLMKIVEILQYNIFYKDNFSSADAYAALERT